MISHSTAHKNDGSSTVDNQTQSQLVIVDVPGADPVIVEAERTEHTPSKTLIWMTESETDCIDLIVRDNVIDVRTEPGRAVVGDAMTDGSDTSSDAREDAHADENQVMADGGDR